MKDLRLKLLNYCNFIRKSYIVKHLNQFFIFYLFAFILVIFFYPVFLGKIPIPFDALVGAYYPWLDYKWGYIVGVPFKNIALSDIFSQVYPWRILSINIFKTGNLPLWNPYSLSGTPLLANWLSAPFYPLNMLLLIFGNIYGWTFLIISQPVLSAFFMYIYLREIGINKLGRAIGAITFSFSGFMMTHMEYATIGQIMLWLPLQLFFIEKYLETKKIKYLCFYSLTFFPVLTAGFFQPAFYLTGISFSYALMRFITVFKRKYYYYILLTIFFTLGISVAAIQMIPTYQLFNNSIRQYDNHIVESGYGLLKPKNLITFISPDFFGNPATNNYWGALHYQETSVYFGAVVLILVIFAILNFRKNIYFKYFTLLFFISLIFAFDNLISRTVYTEKIIGISTEYGSRVLMVTGFSASVLAALATDIINLRKIFKINLTILLLFIATFLLIVINFRYPSGNISSFIYGFFGFSQNSQLYVSLRNMILPLGLLLIYLVVTGILLRFLQLKRKYIVNNYKVIFLFISLLMISIDLLRYGIKFTPFSPKTMTNLDTPITEYLKNNLGYFRIEREWGPVLPPNTWTYFGLTSASGYDPLAILSYARWYRSFQSNQTKDLLDLSNNSYTRYLESNNYNSDYFDLFGIKYLVAIKRNKKGEYDKNGLYFNKNIPLDKFTQVFSEGSLVILENKTVMPRVILFDKFVVEANSLNAQEEVIKELDYRKEVVLNDQPPSLNYKVSVNDSADIVKYLPNSVEIRTNTLNPVVLMLTDTYYPGWNAYLDNEKTSLFIADGIYRSVVVPEGLHDIIFKYEPLSFKLGLFTSIFSAFILILIVLIEKLRTKKAIHNESIPSNWYYESIRVDPFQKYWHQKRFSEVSKVIEKTGGKILDIGCADGLFSKFIFDKSNAQKLVGIDVEEGCVRWANSKWGKEGKIKFYKSDAHNLKFDSDTFDAVFSLEMLEHVKNPGKVLREIKRVLKIGGYTVLLVPTDNILFKLIWFLWLHFYPRGWVWRDTHIQSYRGDTLTGLCNAAGMEIETDKKFNLGMLQLIKARKV